MGKTIDITEQKFGRLTAVRFSHIKKGHYYWLFKCDCGQNATIDKSAVLNNGQISCGCYLIERIKETKTKHGMANRVNGITRFYKIWSGIKYRCNSNNIKAPTYKYYRAKKIKVLWNSFEEFRDDMYKSYIQHVKRYGEKQTQIDRVNTKDNYYKENCRWVTWSEQQSNKTNNIKFNNKTAAKMSLRLSKGKSIIYNRIRRGWSMEKAFTIPYYKKL